MKSESSINPVFAEWQINRMLQSLRSRYRWQSRSLDLPSLKHPVILKTWTRCSKCGTNKVRRLWKEYRAGAPIASSDWSACLNRSLNRYRHNYSSIHRWRAVEYSVLEKMNRLYFPRPFPGSLWNYIAVEKISRLNERLGYPSIDRPLRKSWDTLIYAHREFVRGPLSESVSGISWSLCFLANSERFRRLRSVSDWDGLIADNLSKLSRRYGHSSGLNNLHSGVPA